MMPALDDPEDDSFSYDLFLACVTGLIASANYEHAEIYQRAKVLAQKIYDDATSDKDFYEVMN